VHFPWLRNRQLLKQAASLMGNPRIKSKVRALVGDIDFRGMLSAAAPYIVVIAIMLAITIVKIVLLEHDEATLKPPTDHCTWNPAIELDRGNSGESEPSWTQFGKFQFEQFYVVGVPNGRSLEVWSARPFGGQERGPTDTSISLAGIWSDQQAEPAEVYAARMGLLKRLIGCQVSLSTRVNTLFINGTAIPVTTLTYSEIVRLNSGAVLNELLLRDGLAILDSTQELFPQEREHYGVAQAEAMDTKRGLWSSPENGNFYRQTLLRMAAPPASVNSKPSIKGFSEFLIAQGMLFLFAIVLLVFSWSEPKTRSAALFLLSLPVFFIAPFILIWFAPQLGIEPLGTYPYPLAGRRNFPSDNDIFWLPYYALFFLMLGVWIWAFFVLVRDGPLQEWQSIWKKSRVPETVLLFFLGLIAIVFLLGFLYRGFGEFETFVAALHASVSTALGLPSIIQQGDVASFNLSVVERVIINLWLLICAALLPRPDRTVALGTSRLRAFTVSISSIGAGTLVLASIFAGLYFVSGFADQISECLWFSLSNLFRMSYTKAPSSSFLLQSIQSMEVLVGFFLSLIGFRSILSVLQPQAASGGATP
jgi:hypothetical protein